MRVPGYGPSLPLPHDLAHVVVEGELGLHQGFWGSVAAGALFPGMALLQFGRVCAALRLAASLWQQVPDGGWFTVG